MNSRDNETLIVAIGVAVLAISLLLPLARDFAAEHDVREVKARAVEVKRKLMETAESGKPLAVRVSNIVDGLSPDAALAEAEAQAGEVEMPAAGASVAAETEAVAEKPLAAPAGDGSPGAAAVAPPVADESETQTSRRADASWVWAQ